MKKPNSNNENNVSLKIVLRRLMSYMKLSANALAKTLSLPTPTIQRLLNGEVQDPRSSTLIAIADYFGISIDQLLGRENLTNNFQEQQHADISIARPLNSIPLLSLIEASGQENIKSTSWLRWQRQYKPDNDLNFNCLFAIQIKNNLYEPIFISGSFIIVDSIVNINSGDYVLVRFVNDSISVIKKIYCRR